MGLGNVNNPYGENPLAGRIINVHWKNRGLICGGAATATSVDAWPLMNTHGYVGSGDLEAFNPSPLFAGGCRAGQAWEISVAVQLDMVLGPLGPDSFDPSLPNLDLFTTDASYFAEFSIWKVVGGGLVAMLASTSLSGTLHNESMFGEHIPGSTVTDSLTGTLFAAGTGSVGFAFVANFNSSPSSTDDNGHNVGGGAGFGAVSIQDFE